MRQWSATFVFTFKVRLTGPRSIEHRNNYQCNIRDNLRHGAKHLWTISEHLPSVSIWSELTDMHRSAHFKIICTNTITHGLLRSGDFVSPVMIFQSTIDECIN